MNITEGFISKVKEFSDNEFIVVREVMTWCALDTQFVGLLCKYKNLSDFKEGGWVSIEGIIKVIDNKPLVSISKILKISKSGNRYIHSN
ncbi:hypothetical protein [Clostridium sp.]|uniref:TIGR03943 family putative permease subunit n=1 Tax=Clostridium sp. TaxID=1506 RepID=UPI0034A15EC0